MNISKITKEILAGRDLSKKEHERLIYRIIQRIVKECSEERDKIVEDLQHLILKYPKRMENEIDYIFLPELIDIMRLSKTTLFDWSVEGILPPRVMVINPETNKPRSAWKRSDIEKWLSVEENNLKVENAQMAAAKCKPKKKVVTQEDVENALLDVMEKES